MRSILDYNLVHRETSSSFDHLKETRTRATYNWPNPKFIKPIKILAVTRDESRGE